jgi:hypothetical protein
MRRGTDSPAKPHRLNLLPMSNTTAAFSAPKNWKSMMCCCVVVFCSCAQGKTTNFLNSTSLVFTLDSYTFHAHLSIVSAFVIIIMAGFGTTPSNTFFEKGMEQQYRKTGQLDEGQPVLFDIAWEVSDQCSTRIVYSILTTNR